MRSLTFLAAAAFVARAAGDATCADKAAAGLNPPEACVVPYTFPAGTQVGNHSLPAAWLGPAPVCYTQYYQNQLATPTFMPRNSACSAYANRGCCSSEMVQSIDNEQYGTTGVYPGYGSRCGPLSEQCLNYFKMEACFYECDHNIGEYRKYPTCIDSAGEQNAWQIENMPLSSTMVDAWFTACSNDLFCTGPSGSYFDLPSLTCVPPTGGALETATCRKFSNIYGNATNMITQMWDGSFSYAPAGTVGYTFPIPGATPFDNVATVNPNNAAAIANNKVDPPFCGFRTAVSGWAQAMSDFNLYVANMLKYTGMTYAGALYAGTTTPGTAWFDAPAPDATPAPVVCSSAPKVAAAAATAAAAAALATLLA